MLQSNSLKNLWTAILMIISIVALGFVVSLTFNVLTFQALADFNLVYLAWILLGLVILVGFDSLSTMIFARASLARIPVPAAVKSSFLRVFVNMITPFGIGGHPFVVAYLKGKGVPSGLGSSITATKLVIVSIFVLLGGIWGFFKLSSDGSVTQLVLVIMGLSILFQALLIFILLFLMVRPQSAVGILTRIVRLFRRSNVSHSVQELKKNVVHQAWLSRRCFRLCLSQGIGFFLLGCVLHLCMYIAELVMLWLVFQGLGYPISLSTCMAVAALMLLVTSFLPTPGGTGLGEGAFVVLFASIAPAGILGISVVLWRVFYNYLIAFVGLLISPRSVRAILTR